MSAAGAGAASGVVIGLVAVLLGQQFGYLDLGTLSGGLTLLVEGAVGFGILFAAAGWAIGRRYLRRNPPGATDSNEGAPVATSAPKDPPAK
ncbi:MAG: hypothetical protein L3K18_07480 [Thermoplasmata archaeon]|nr:hypothetical protein [Thermoplasmata archaeon]